MALAYSEWLQRAQRLTEGRSARVDHDCGEGRTMLIEHNAEGFRCWCHRCHEGGFKPHGQQALSKIIARWNAAAGDHNDYTIVLPDDLTRLGLPWPATRWLSKAGLTEALCEKYGIGYSPHYGRVYLPVYSASGRGNARRLEYYQARAVHDGQAPKYLNPKVDKANLVFSTEYPAQGRQASAAGRRKETAVVTEDILSAIRVGEVQSCRGISILGTAPSAGQINYLSQFPRCVIWLDPDNAGKKATRVLKRSLDMVGVPYEVMTSERDPKMYSFRQLQEMLWRLT
jgi:hypothetical protein